MEDSQIIALYFRRDESALAAAQQKYGGYCFSIAHGVLGNREDAAEAVNDAYLASWNAIPPHTPNRLSAFLGKLTRRIAINRWQEAHAAKRGGGEPALALEELAQCIPGGQTPEQTLEGKELTQLLSAFLRALPETERQVFLARYWNLEPIKDIARRFGFTQSKVKSMLYRTRSRLRARLEKEEISL